MAASGMMKIGTELKSERSHSVLQVMPTVGRCFHFLDSISRWTNHDWMNDADQSLRFHLDATRMLTKKLKNLKQRSMAA